MYRLPAHNLLSYELVEIQFWIFGGIPHMKIWLIELQKILVLPMQCNGDSIRYVQAPLKKRALLKEKV